MGRRPRPDPRQQDGLVVLDKPSGITSAGCLERMKRVLGQTRIGHAGTLDPLATGVLLVLLGEGTKLAPCLTGGEKTYSGQLRLGLTTDTYDIEGRVTAEAPVAGIEPERVAEEIRRWTLLTEQVVPPFSAAKHQGRPLYALARAGEEVPAKTKAVEIFSAEVLEMDLPLARFRVRVGSGTYVRSLVHSLGMRIGRGAVLTELRRERSRPYGLEEAHGLEELLADPAGFPARVIPLAQALPHWSRGTLDARQADLVRNGAALAADEVSLDKPGDEAMLLGPGNEPLALARLGADGERKRWVILRGLGRRGTSPGATSAAHA